MKAILKDDIIVKLSLTKGTEIGNIPKGFGLNALRWDGEKIVILPKLDQIWVEYINNTFVLHCKKVRKSQLVTMKFNQRKRLTIEDNVIKLKPKPENPQRVLYRKKRQREYPDIGDQLEAIWLLINSLNVELPPATDFILNKIKQIKLKYPKWEPSSKSSSSSSYSSTSFSYPEE